VNQIRDVTIFRAFSTILRAPPFGLRHSFGRMIGWPRALSRLLSRLCG
jgi:hypothetical protein